MTLSNDEFAALGVGTAVGAGAALIAPAFGLVMGCYGILTVFYAFYKRRQEAEDESDNTNIETDGGTATRETPATAATEQPAVLDVDVVGDRVLASCEKGDVSVVVDAPTGVSAAELEATLDGVPESIERTTEQFADTTTMSANTTEIDGSTDAEDATGDDFGGGA